MSTKKFENFEKAYIVREMVDKVLGETQSSDVRRVLIDLYDLQDSSLAIFYDALQYARKAVINK
ncbi:hypothetical protein [Caulobacter phage Cr30]|uniref:hypothetical protein n=1 Tax=Caulobacter phage Cr30 TaxID=1357714 RepID=UPI0004A9B940|nr:hypothetical protein OZ74_gp065 [Caulobacter phage Cr30]AGS80950.1 hypothetical protein [Caulobacter phage Cr30]